MCHIDSSTVCSRTFYANCVDNDNKLAYLFFDNHDQNLSNWYFCGFFVQIRLRFLLLKYNFFLSIPFYIRTAYLQKTLLLEQTRSSDLRGSHLRTLRFEKAVTFWTTNTTKNNNSWKSLKGFLIISRVRPWYNSWSSPDDCDYPKKRTQCFSKSWLMLSSAGMALIIQYPVAVDC